MARKPKSEIYAEFYERRHPMYDALLEHWRFCESTYKGGRNWFSENIFRYFKEGPGEYADRIQRAYRFNHTREVVELVQKYLFKVGPARSNEAPDAVKKFWKRSTLSGASIDHLVRVASTASSITGVCAVVIDNNMGNVVAEKENISVAEADKARVYGYIVNARDILDYAWDEDGDGELLWVKLREHVRDDANFLTSSGEIYERVRVWTRTEWFLYTKKTVRTRTSATSVHSSETAEVVELTDKGTHDLGFVPVKIFRHQVTDEPYISSGLIDEIAYMDRAVANYLSNLDAIIQDQTFSQLAIPAQSLSNADGAEKKAVEMGTKRIFTYDGGSGSNAKPEYLSPDPKQAGVILESINKIISEIYHTIGLAGERTKEDNSVGIDNSSGVAKAYDFERVNSLLLSKAQSCELLENWIIKAVCAWHHVDQDEEEQFVTYPTTFDVMRLVDDLVTAEALQKINAPSEIRKLQMKGLAKKLFPQIDAALEKKIEADIDKWETSPVVTASTVPNPTGSKATAEGSRQGQVTSKTEKINKAKGEIAA